VCATEQFVLFPQCIAMTAAAQVGDDYWLWFQKFHHIIIDATGRRLLSARTACRYRALRFGEPLSVMKAATPGELLDVEQRYMVSTIYDVDRNYWREQFARWPGPLHEIDRANTERIKSGRPARASFTLKRGDFARQAGAPTSGRICRGLFTQRADPLREDKAKGLADYFEHMDSVRQRQQIAARYVKALLARRGWRCPNAQNRHSDRALAITFFVATAK
jgi:hypothetical protein